MRNQNGRFELRWESTSTSLSDGFDYRDEAIRYAGTFKDKSTITFVALFDQQEKTFELLKGKLPSRYAKAIPVYDNVRMSRRQMLLLERVLVKIADGDWVDSGDEQADDVARELLVGVKSVREGLEERQDYQRRLTAATK